MTFNDIPGQEDAALRIKQAIDNDRLPHALLISGREGSGAMSLALATAQYLLCERRAEGPNEQGACCTCPQCIQVQHLQHPDLHFVYPVVNKAKSPAVSISVDYIEEWRDMLRRNPEMTLLDWTCYTSEEGKQANISAAEANDIIRILSTKPYESDYRVMIIWLPERMNEAASNKLLKIIEEPYEKTHFLLVSFNPDRIIGTILSRCQRINLPPLNPNWMQPHLDEDDRERYLDLFTQMMRKSYARKLFEMKEWAEEMAGMGRPSQIAFLQYAQAQIRENFIQNIAMTNYQDDGTPSPDGDLSYIYQEADEAKFSFRFAPFVNHLNVEGIMQELALAEGDIQQNANARIVFFDLSLKLIMQIKKGG